MGMLEFILVLGLHSVAMAVPPHIVFVLVDDWGYNDVGWRSTDLSGKTPTIDALATQGIKLNHYYTQALCTPTRGALMSGRYPIRLGLQHGVIGTNTVYGLPLNETTLAQRLKDAGYSTHAVGKWHLGYYNWASTPTERGFDSWYGYYNGMEDYYNHEIANYLDLRDNKAIVSDKNNVYSAGIYWERIQSIITNHDATTPMFLYYPMQEVHMPLENPPSGAQQCSDIPNADRKTYCAMITIADQAISNLTKALQAAGMWDNMVFIVSSDNGGLPNGGGYNWPLRSHKGWLFEGGVRGTSFVVSNLIPEARRGSSYEGLVHVSDWHPTLTLLGGGDISSGSGFPLDGLNIWDAIIENTKSPRTEILLNIDDITERNPISGAGLIQGDWKLLQKVHNDTWYPVPTTHTNYISESDLALAQCLGRGGCLSGSSLPPPKPVVSCLFNITNDPNEHINLYDKYPDVVKSMIARIDEFRSVAIPPGDTTPDQAANQKASQNGAWSPWL